MSADAPLIALRRAVFGYGRRAVVEVEQLDLHHGRCLGIFGPNGAGKTTLVRGLSGLLKPLAGEIDRAPALRFGYLPQRRGMELHWPMTGLDAACLAVSARSRVGWVGANMRKVLQSMRAMNVGDLAHRRFAELSGGQQQRLLLAGAMASEPQVLILDEPTDGLDVHSRDALLQVLKTMIAGGLCVVLISHEIEDLLALSDESAWLRVGDEPGRPSRVETIATAELADRVVGGKTTGASFAK